jgi:hypothetical protein
MGVVVPERRTGDMIASGGEIKLPVSGLRSSFYW